MISFISPAQVGCERRELENLTHAGSNDGLLDSKSALASRSNAGAAAVATVGGIGTSRFDQACSGDSVRGEQPRCPAGMQVKVETARLVSVRDMTEYVANAEVPRIGRDHAKVEGPIAQIYVRSGAHVAPGTPLMQIDPAKQQANLKRQEDMLAATEAEVVGTGRNMSLTAVCTGRKSLASWP
jgi:multidrug efflux pump subunit AcrA (membrane-fusion protein)